MAKTIFISASCSWNHGALEDALAHQRKATRVPQALSLKKGRQAPFMCVLLHIVLRNNPLPKSVEA
jgi:hypothetical protein